MVPVGVIVSLHLSMRIVPEFYLLYEGGLLITTRTPPHC